MQKYLKENELIELLRAFKAACVRLPFLTENCDASQLVKAHMPAELPSTKPAPPSTRNGFNPCKSSVYPNRGATCVHIHAHKRGVEVKKGSALAFGSL